MRIDDITTQELEILRRLIAEAIAIWDYESPTLYGLSQMEMEGILENWPMNLERNSFRAALAINNVCGDFLGGSNARHYRPELFPETFGATDEEVEALLTRLTPRLISAIDKANT